MEKWRHSLEGKHVMCSQTAGHRSVCADGLCNCRNSSKIHDRKGCCNVVPDAPSHAPPSQGGCVCVCVVGSIQFLRRLIAHARSSVKPSASHQPVTFTPNHAVSYRDAQRTSRLFRLFQSPSHSGRMKTLLKILEGADSPQGARESRPCSPYSSSMQRLQ